MIKYNFRKLIVRIKTLCLKRITIVQLFNYKLQLQIKIHNKLTSKKAYITLLTLIICFISLELFAGGVKGYLTNTKGEPLPYASIYINQIQSGTTTNSSGYFEISLPSGTYDFVFQYLGYNTFQKRINVNTKYIELNISLAEKSVQLKSAVVYAGKEDPAYTLMRKAIAKAPFHLNELDSYSAQVYMKGTGRVIDAPFFIRKKLAEEGFDSTTAYISETVTKVRYERPNTYHQEVISTRTSGSNNNTAQNQFIFGSFYEPEVGNWISPLSPKAFSTYRFKYIESFEDRGYTINKIQVTPRSKGDNVVEGYLFLVENDWNIYRLNFVTYVEGIKILIRGVSAPIEPKIWLPITMKFEILGSYFGVDFEYKYLATIGNYEVEINPDLNFDIEVVDEKLDKELASQIENLDKKLEKQEGSVSISDKKDQKVTRKQLKKLLKEYESSVEVETDTKDVNYNYDMTTDSLANKKEATYWDSIRSVPLDSHEIRGYQKLDSIMVAQDSASLADSTKRATFSPIDLLFGHTFKLKDSSKLRIIMPLSFNTVDGFLVGARLNYMKKLKEYRRIQFSGETHYGFSRTALLGQGGFKYSFGSPIAGSYISAMGGKMDAQINKNRPISPGLNTLTTLLMQDNFMKVYQSEFAHFKWHQSVNSKVAVELGALYSSRQELFNTTDFTFIKYHNRGYTVNLPENKEAELLTQNGLFSQEERFILSANIEFKPWQKVAIRNGEKSLIDSSSPLFTVYFEQANPFSNSKIQDNKLIFGYQHYIKVKGNRRLRINGKVGTSFTKSNSFLDYNHFMGNQSPIVDPNPANQYRMLSYYGNSTAGEFATVFMNYEFRKFALTQFTFVRMTGLKENVFINYLYTGYGNTNYMEMGYSLNNIFRMFRVEVVTNNQATPFSQWAIRFGLTTNFASSFGN